MIDIANLGLKLDSNKYLFKKITFNIPSGETLLIIGQSGSGKTTLLKVISGLIGQDEGSVSYDGVDISKISDSSKNIGMVFQNDALFDNMTADENIIFPLRYILKKSRTDAMNITEELIKKLSLGDIYGKEIKALSGGMRKRVAIARAIAFKPRYLFLDEPFQGLDPISANKIKELFIDIKNEYSPTIIIISNDLKFVLNFSDKIGLLDNERFIFYQTQKEFLNSHDGPGKKFLKFMLGFEN